MSTNQDPPNTIPVEDIINLRDHVSKIIKEKLNGINQASLLYNQHTIRIKSWCITLFIVTTGYCIKEKSSLGQIFYFLPFVPIIFFWILEVFRRYYILEYQNHPNKVKLENILGNLYRYSYNELLIKSDQVSKIKFTWKDKGKLNYKRFFKVKLIGIIRLIYRNLENLIFYCGLLILWLVILFAM